MLRLITYTLPEAGLAAVSGRVYVCVCASASLGCTNNHFNNVKKQRMFCRITVARIPRKDSTDNDQVHSNG
eukprot:4004545-Amphidinium_carterae.1